jgi:hypothetical protein
MLFRASLLIIEELNRLILQRFNMNYIYIMDRNLALLLRSKPQPKPQSNVIIKLKLEVEHNDPVEIEEGEIVEEKEGPARVLIKDGRKTSTVNRDRILKRLKGIVQEEEEVEEDNEENGKEKDQDKDEEDKEERVAKPAVKKAMPAKPAPKTTA